MPKNRKGHGNNKDTEPSRNSGSEPRVDPNTSSCGLCGELFVNCVGHPELPGMTSNGQED